MNLKERAAVGKIQNLIGSALGAHYNDRNQNHIQDVANPLQEAFQICVDVLSKYPIPKENPHD